jgi:predicted small secreted protein
MAMSSRKLLFPALGAIAITLTACNTWNRHIGDEDPYLGEAVKYNAAVQTINPEPVYAEGSAQPGDNGDKGAQAVRRYRTDKVNERHTKESRVRSSGLSTTQGPE